MLFFVGLLLVYIYGKDDKEIKQLRLVIHFYLKKSDHINTL